MSEERRRSTDLEFGSAENASRVHGAISELIAIFDFFRVASEKPIMEVINGGSRIQHKIEFSDRHVLIALFALRRALGTIT